MKLSRLQKIPGLPPDAARVLLEAVNGVIDELARIGGAIRMGGLQRAGKVASEGELVRMRGGQRLTLPRARVENAGKFIYVIQETAGTLTVVAHQGQVNGATSVAFTTIGLYIFQSNGVSGWFSVDRDSGDTGFPLAGHGLEYVPAGTLRVDEAAAFLWTGQHTFNALALGQGAGIFSATLAANANDLAIGAVTVVRIIGNNFSLTGMVPAFEGQTVLLLNADGVDSLFLEHEDVASAASNRFRLPGLVQFEMGPRSMTVAQHDDTSDSWFIVGQVPGGGGGASFALSTVEVNLGTGAVSGSFTIAGAGMPAGNPVICVQAVGPYTGKGSLEDVAEEPVWCTAVVTSAVLITVYWQSARKVAGNVKFNYAVG